MPQFSIFFLWKNISCKLLVVFHHLKKDSPVFNKKWACNNFFTFRTSVFLNFHCLTHSALCPFTFEGRHCSSADARSAYHHSTFEVLPGHTWMRLEDRWLQLGTHRSGSHRTELLTARPGHMTADTDQPFKIMIHVSGWWKHKDCVAT